MGSKAELDTLKTRAIAAIRRAADAGDTIKIQRLSNLLGEIEAAEKRATALDDDVKSYTERLDGRDKTRSHALRAKESLTTTGAISRKQFGKEMRERFAREHGLIPVRGAIYKTRSGSRLGIATAAETRPGHWFLGLPDTDLDCVVLICEGHNERLDFVLPMTSISSAWPRLSRSAGQVKFNVDRRNGSYRLQVPRNAPIDIGPFVGRYTPLY